MTVDEDLPNFFKAVKMKDAEWLVKESTNLWDNYGFDFLERRVRDQFGQWKMSKNPIQGCTWYHILANRSYAMRFNYIDVNVPSRSDLIVDGDDDEENDCEQSDVVQILLNLAYAPTSLVKNFKFGPGISKEFKKLMKEEEKIIWG